MLALPAAASVLVGFLVTTPASASSVSSPSVSAGPSTAGANATYTVAFTTSLNGTLVPSQTITMWAAPGTSFRSCANATQCGSEYEVTYGSSHTGVQITAATASQIGTVPGNNEVVLEIGLTGSIPANSAVTVLAWGVTNATTAGSNPFSISTSSDTTTVWIAYNITPASPSTLAFVQQPTNVLSGQAMSPAPAVQVEDAYGNATADGGVSVALTANPSTPVSGNAATTNASGLATFSALSIGSPGSYTLTATGSGLSSAVSSGFTVWLVTKPNAPNGVTTNGGNGSASVTWQAPTANGGPPPTSYTVTGSPGGYTNTVMPRRPV